MVRRSMWSRAEDDAARAMANQAVQQVNAAVAMANTAIADGAVDRQSLRQMVSILQTKVAALETIAAQALNGELETIIGPAGANGREVQLRTAPSTTQLGETVQWRYAGDMLWHDLVALDDLRGEPGPPGDTGQRGPAGEPGLKGADGANGRDGVDGGRGPAGEQGPPGVKGDTGAQGPKGDQGVPGVKGDRGDTGIQGERGEPGPKGDAGASGVKGDTGAQGVQGERGPQGVKGDTGAQGPKGDQGLPGLTGANAAANQRVGLGTVPALTLGASVDVTVTWDLPMPSSTYHYSVALGALVGKGTCTWKSQTATSITFTVKSTALIISAGTVFVVVAWAP